MGSVAITIREMMADLDTSAIGVRRLRYIMTKAEKMLPNYGALSCSWQGWQDKTDYNDSYSDHSDSIW